MADQDHHKTKQSMFKHWAQMSFWEIDESVALLLGYNPTNLSYNEANSKETSWQLRNFYRALYEKYRRSVFARELRERSPPEDVIEWARLRDLSVDEVLVKEVSEFASKKAKHQSERLGCGSSSPTNDTNVNPNQEAEHEDPRIITSMTKIMLGMAMDKYGFKPDEPSSAARLIVDSIANAGLKKQSEKNVLYHLREAHKHLSEKGMFERKK